MGTNEKQYCYGSRYNFKKGMEHCPHSKECPHSKNMDEAINLAYKETQKIQPIFFYTVKEFRKCTKHLDCVLF